MSNTIGGVNVMVSAEVDASGAVSGFAKISDSAKKVESDLKSMDATASSSGNAISAASNKAAKASKKAATAFKFQKGGMAQLGQQIQDVAVMSQFGADKFIILGTQGSQIASLFGPGGAVFGAVLAISAAIGGTLVKSLFDGGAATEELRDKLKELSKEYELTAEESAFLATEEAKTTKELQKRADALKKLIAENEKEKKGRKPAAPIMGMGGAIISAEMQQRAFEKSIAATNEEIEKQRAELAGVERQISKIELVKKVEQEKRSEFKRTADLRMGLIRQGLDNDKEMAQIERTNRAAVSEGLMSDEVAAARKRELLSNQALNSKFQSLKIRLDNEKKLLIDSKLLEGEELAIAQAEIDAAIIEADATKKGLLLNNEEAFSKALGEIKKKAADSDKKLSEAKKQSELASVSQTFRALSSLMNTESRKLFEIGKAAALSGAIVDSIAAVVKTMTTVAYPFNIPLAAAQAVAGAVQVQNIAKQKFGGGSSGATSFSGGAPAVNTQQSPQQQTQTVDVRVTAAGGGVVDMFNFEVANGASPIMG